MWHVPNLEVPLMISQFQTDRSELLPPPLELRQRLATAMREVEVLRGLLRLAERVAARDGRPAINASDVKGDNRAD